MAEVINVSVRETRGTSHARRDRLAGNVPAILYGHGQENVSLLVPKDEIDAAIRHGSQVVELRGGVNESALMRDVQWDPLGVDVLHLDLARVVAGEVVEVSVNVELRGEAPGTKEGGIVTHVLHEVELECPVMSIPEKLSLTINSLQVGESLTAADLQLPSGSKLLTDPDAIVVQCVEAAPEEEEEDVSATGVEPEVIGRKPDEEADSD